MVAALAVASCGPRLPHSSFVAATQQQGGLSGATTGGAAGGVAAGGPGGQAESTGAAGSSLGAAPGALGSGAGGGPAAGEAGAGGAAPASAAQAGTGAGPASAVNGASDVGVTPTSILVGNITSIGGPLGPNVFSPSYYGAAAYFRWLNDRGGINGRQIRFVTCDDKEDPNLDLQCAQSLIQGQKVFALAVNDSRVENGAASFVNSKGVPAVGDFCIGNWCAKYPEYFGGGGGSFRYPRDGKSVGINGTEYTQDGPFKWLKDHVGVTKAAVFFYSIAISRQAGLLWAASLKRQGIDVVYYGGGSDQGENPAAPTYDTDVVQMKSKGVDMIVNAIDMNGFQKLCQSMDRYGFTVKANLGNPQAYGQVVQTFSSPCRNSVFSFDQAKDYADVGDPAVAEVRAAMRKYYPNVPLHDWVLTGWASARMFADAVAALGTNVTRVGLVRQLDGMRNYTAGGLVAAKDFQWPYDYSKPAPECFSIAQWQDSAGTMVERAPLSTCYTMPWESYAPLDDGS